MLPRMIWAPAARRSSGLRLLTVPCVPTGMKAGVSTAPCARGEPAAAGRAVGGEELEAEALTDQAGVAVRVEPVAGRQRVAVGGQDQLAPGEGGDEDQQRGARQVEVGQQRVDDAEAVAGSRNDGGVAVERRHRARRAAPRSPACASTVVPTATTRRPAAAGGVDRRRGGRRTVRPARAAATWSSIRGALMGRNVAGPTCSVTACTSIARARSRASSGVERSAGRPSAPPPSRAPARRPSGSAPSPRLPAWRDARCRAAAAAGRARRADRRCVPPASSTTRAPSSSPPHDLSRASPTPERRAGTAAAPGTHERAPACGVSGSRKSSSTGRPRRPRPARARGSPASR